MENVTPRIVNIALGVWLFISAFAWPHTYAEQTNAWILGLLCVLFSAVALAYPQVRYLNTALAVWLFVSTFMMPSSSSGTVWNNIIVALAIFAVSLIPSPPLRKARRVGSPPSRHPTPQP